ncbi:tyrosine-type recombinase/integrase [Pseudonocardia adelaidensis]|uniref:Integrase SAM-like N-terminal domain-containing protein n=1 Tax=Pseudonocardia adelaidensis TaxID=648754 RepID=A0ABP9P8S1_9PSEU
MPRKRTRQRGEIEARASGSLRVRVYAGVDALTGRPHYLTESVPAGPKAYAEAEEIRRRLGNQVDEQRNPRTKATVNQLMDRYLELLDVEETTHERYEQAIRIHIRPLLGHLPVAKLDGETLTPTKRSCAVAGPTATAGHTSSTRPTARTTARPRASPTSAGRSRRRPFGRCISA